MPRPRAPFVLPILVLLVGLVPPLLAQEVGEVAQAFGNNLRRLQGYTWKSEVEFYVDGVPKGSKTYQVTWRLVA